MIDFSTMPPAIGSGDPGAENEEQKRYRLAHTMPPAVSAQPKAAPDRTVMPPIPSSAAPMRPNASAVGATSQPSFAYGPEKAATDANARAIPAPEIDRNVMPPIPGAGLKVAPGQPSKPASFGDAAPAPVDRSVMPPIPQSGAEKHEQELRAQGRPGSPEGPDLPWWKRALDTVAQIHPIGRLIERNIPGSPGNFDWELARATAASEQERGATKEKQGIETSASQAQFNTPEKRRAYMAQHPDEFQDVSDFQKNDFILAGKFPQKEPAEAKTGTPEEQTLHDLMTGENGNPRVNPETGKPFTYLEAYKATNAAKAEGKPGKDLNAKEDLQRQIAAADAKGDKETVKKLQARLKAIDPEGQQRIVLQQGNANDKKQNAKEIAQGIIAGDQPPTLTGLRENTAEVRAELHRRGFNLARATQDWHATEKHLATLNGAQQERLRQAVSFTSDSLGIIEDLYNQWQKVGKTSGWKAFNRASLETAKQLPGDAGNIAHRLEAQINDLTAELGTVYKGGNSSTDESLKLAAQNLKADWNEKTFKDALGQVRQNLEIRQNSIRHSQPAGVSGNSPYTPTEEGNSGGGFADWKKSQKP